jgi:hypothetical protein
MFKLENGHGDEVKWLGMTQNGLFTVHPSSLFTVHPSIGLDLGFGLGLVSTFFQFEGPFFSGFFPMARKAQKNYGL